MSAINVTFAYAGSMNLQADQPAYQVAGSTSEALTSSGTSAATTATALEGQFARVAPVDGGVYVTAGAAPTAVTAQGFYVASGSVLDLAVRAGDKIAVVD